MRRLKKELWPHKVTLDSDWKGDINPVEQWLGEQVGIFRGRWNVVYKFNRTEYYFKNSQDATLFALKWS